MAVTNATPGGTQVKVPQVKVTVTHTASSAHQAAKGAAGALKSVTTPKGGKAAAANTATQAQQPQAFNPLGGFLSSQQLGSLANNITATNTRASVMPLQAQNKTLGNEEQTAQNRYSGYMSTAQGIIQGLAQNAQGSALSNENAAAQAANTTANAIDQTGSSAAALAGGWQSPGLQAALQSQRQFEGTTQGAEAGLIGSQGANLNDFLTSLRGAAALQLPEGEQNIASAFQKPIASNNAAIQAALARQPAAAKSLAATLGQQQFTDYATLLADKTKASTARATQLYQQGELANKNQANQIAAQRVNVTAQNNQANQKIRAAQVAGNNAYHQALIGVDYGRLSEKQTYDQGTLAIRRLTAQTGANNASEKVRHDHATESLNLQKFLKGTTSGSAYSQKEGAKIVGEAANYLFLTNNKNPSTGKTVSAFAAQALLHQKMAGDGAGAAAAIELATQGWVSTDTQQALQRQGVTVPAAWTANRGKGMALQTALGTLKSAAKKTKLGQ